jgi:hypothetical protein
LTLLPRATQAAGKTLHRPLPEVARQVNTQLTVTCRPGDEQVERFAKEVVPATRQQLGADQLIYLAPGRSASAPAERRAGMRGSARRT